MGVRQKRRDFLWKLRKDSSTPSGPCGIRKVLGFSPFSLHHHSVEATAWHPGMVGHCRERASHGLWEHGQRLRYWCCLHSWSFHWAELFLRRVFGECSRGRCCGRNSYSTRAHHPSSPVPWKWLAFARRGYAKHLQGIVVSEEPARGALQGHAGHRIHHPTGKALHVADAQWKAYCSCCLADCCWHGKWRFDHKGAGPPELETGLDRSAIAPNTWPQGEEGHHSSMELSAWGIIKRHFLYGHEWVIQSQKVSKSLRTSLLRGFLLLLARLAARLLCFKDGGPTHCSLVVHLLFTCCSLVVHLFRVVLLCALIDIGRFDGKCWHVKFLDQVGQRAQR